MPPSLEDRRRRALYRATHRGTKEMDWLLGRFATARLPAMNEVQLAEFERLLALPDPDLQVWLLTGEGYESSELAPTIELVRRFHEPGKEA
jgi:antitoxin CptB